MAVRLHRGLHALVTAALCNQQRRKAHLHQQTGVTVPNIVYANFLDAGFLAAALHFVRQEILRIWEYPVSRFREVNEMLDKKRNDCPCSICWRR